MEELPREFYRLDELAERCSQTENDLYQMAAAGDLILSYSFDGKYKGILCKPGDDPHEFDIDSALATLFEGPDRYHTGYVNLFQSEARAVAAHCNNPLKTFSSTIIKTISGNVVALSEPFKYSIKDLFVLIGEAERLRAEFPGLAPQQGKLEPTDSTEYLNGQDAILDYFKPITWMTIKKWLRNYGVSEPEKGDIWRVKVVDAVAIRVNKKSFIEIKLKIRK